jgi:hypothetical protein
MRIASRVVDSQELRDFAPSKVRIEIDKTIHHDRNPTGLPTTLIDQAPELPCEIFPETVAELSQAVVRPIKVRGNAVPCPVNVVMSD